MQHSSTPAQPSSMASFVQNLHKVFYQSNLLYSVRIIISLIGTTFIPWYLGEIEYVIPLTLGVVAAALTEIDTRLLSRLINIVLTLLCFAIASFSVQFLFDYTWLFMIGLVSSTFLFTMLGSLGQKYAVIAFGSLLVAADTMIAHSMFENSLQLPIYLLVGALWYNLVSLPESLLQPVRTTQQVLSDSFIKLALYIDAKAAMFDPDETDNFTQQTAQLTKANSQLIEVFNHTKSALFNRIKSYQGQPYIRKMLSYYFVAQDIHERASSAHGNCQTLSRYFKHSDILFRFARILNLQSKACAEVGVAIRQNQPYLHSPMFANYFAYLDEAITRFKHDEQDEQNGINAKTAKLLIKSLRGWYHNLMAIDLLLANIDQQQQSQLQTHNQLIDDELISFHDIFAKFKKNLTVKSSLFRHAVRMSLVSLVCYAVIKLTDMPHGYWIMLTSLFVCQPNYSTTKHRLKLRVVGTLLGLLVGVPLTLIFPQVEIQLMFIVLSVWLFFLFKNSQYAYATAFVTLLVCFIFDLIGESTLQVAIFRVIATIMGCGIAWLAVSYIWPDWKFRNLANLIERACSANSDYMLLIGGQYQSGKTNDVNYRLARRAVHDSNADLSALISIMTKEPHLDKEIIEQSFRLLTLNHTLISYLSTLGAHREKALLEPTLALFDDVTVHIIDALHCHQIGDDYLATKQKVVEYLDAMIEPSEIDHHDLLITQQLLLILDILPEMMEIAAHLKATP